MIEPGELAILASWPDGIQPGVSDVAHIDIRVGSVSFTFLAEEQTNQSRTFVRASAVSLAFWLIDNWWRLRFEPFPDALVPATAWRLRHELSSIQGGTLWPPIMIYGEGARVFIAPRAGIFDVAGPVRYLPVPFVALDGRMYERKVDAFFESVLGHCAQALDGAAFERALAALRRERSDSETAAWRTLEAQLGYDVDAAPQDLMSAMDVYGNRYGLDAIGEAAVSAPGSGSARAIAEAIDAAQNSQLSVNAGAARELVTARQRPEPDLPPWKLAEAAAGELRNRMDKRGKLTNADLGDLLETNGAMVAPPTARTLPYAALLTADALRDQCALRSEPNSCTRRFELGRILGDAAWMGARDRADTFAPISRAKSDRQKYQRAFSQSLLVPFGELLEIVDAEAPTEEQIVEAVEHFDVDRRVVHTVLVNKKVLEREAVEDQIEAA